MTLATLSTGQLAVVAVLFLFCIALGVWGACTSEPTHPDEDAVLRSADRRGER